METINKNQLIEMLDNLIKDAEEWIKDAEKRFDWLDVNYYRGAQYAYTLVKRAAEKWDSQNEITKTVKIVFTRATDGGYYIEETTTEDILEICKRWRVKKIIDETKDYSAFNEVMKELNNPTVKEYNQFVVIQELHD